MYEIEKAATIASCSLLYLVANQIFAFLDQIIHPDSSSEVCSSDLSAYV